MEIALKAKIKCSHCAEPVVTPFEDNGGHSFCCQGCMSVYQILQQSNLGKFYSIQEQTGDYTKPVKRLKHKDFKYLESSDFIEKYAHQDDQALSMSFYLQGVHCLACLWLIEKLPELVPSVKNSHLDMGKSLVTITLENGQTSFSEAAKCLNNLGYDPYPISNQSELEEKRKNEERGLLLRIGIAAFSMMNIMLYTGSVYAGAKGMFQIGFGYLSLILSLPVVLYSATPFYKSAIAAIKNKQVNIDIPLSLAILFGFFISSVFVFLHKEEFYFDSIATLTFLILLSRYILTKAQQTSLNRNDLMSIFLRQTALRKKADDESYEEVLPNQLKIQDIVKVSTNEVFPCDGTIIKGNTRVNLSALTGESQSVFHGLHSNVFMGTVNLGDTVEVEVQVVGNQTRMGKLLYKIQNEQNQRSNYSYITDRVSRYFVQGILLLSVLVFTYFIITANIVIALEHTLALIIVTCPCALGIATPLTFSRIMALAQRSGIIVKSEEAIERLSQIKNILFDKTGTLTTGNYQVTQFEYHSHDSTRQTEINNILFSLEAKSNHPVAQSLVKWCSTQKIPLNRVHFDSFEEILGFGVRGFFKGSVYKVTTEDTGLGFSSACLFENDSKLLSLRLEDDIKSDANKTLERLRNNEFETYLVSGDKKSVVEKIRKKLLFSSQNTYSEASPEQKSKIVKDLKNTLFVGDGANDSIAFKEADASIATHGSVEMCLRTSDIFLGEDNLLLIPFALNLAKRAMKTVRINLAFSLIYNIVGASLAIIGLIGPLEAAILMPMSSLTILVITLYQTNNGVAHGNT